MVSRPRIHYLLISLLLITVTLFVVTRPQAKTAIDKNDSIFTVVSTHASFTPEITERDTINQAVIVSQAVALANDGQVIAFTPIDEKAIGTLEPLPFSEPLKRSGDIGMVGFPFSTNYTTGSDTLFYPRK